MLNINVQKQFGDFLLRVEVMIKPGFTAVFGPSGAGKTTLLNLIAGLAQPDNGTITLDEQLLYSSELKVNVRPQKRRIGYIFQESRLFPHLSVRRNLEFGYQRTKEKDRKFKFEEITRISALSGLLARETGDLSGGEKQRVSFARALLASPDYLLMDEPLAALDSPTRLGFLNFVEKMHREFGIPVLYVSHDLSNVLSLAEQVVLLEDGKFVAYAPPYTLVDKMKRPGLSPSDDIPNLFEVEIENDPGGASFARARSEKAEFMLPKLADASHRRLLLNIPAAEIILSLDRPRAMSASNVLCGIITEICHLGQRILVKVDAGELFVVEVIPTTVKRLALRTEMRVFLIIKASAFRRIGVL